MKRDFIYNDLKIMKYEDIICTYGHYGHAHNIQNLSLNQLCY